MERRDFVIKGGLASAAALLPCVGIGSGFQFDGSPNESLNIGVIGTGSRGTGIISLIKNIENLNVIACCDTLPFRLATGIKGTDNKAKDYKNYKKLLENPDIDAVFIATPFSTHSQIAMDALDTGKHVYCEKTMAKGFNGVKLLLNKVKTSNKVFQTGHQYHSSRLYVHVVDLIKSGKIGKIAAFDCQWNRNGNWRRPVPKLEYERRINWRMYREYSGGLLAELCSHQIDFVNWVLEATPNQVMGVGGIDYWKDGRETYDNIHLIYNYPNGVKAKFTCLTSNANNDYKIKVMGDKGTIILDHTEAWFYPEGEIEKKLGEVDGVSGATAAWKAKSGIPIEVNHKDPTKQALIDFRESIVNNTTPISNGVTGANTALAVQMGLDAMINNEIFCKKDQK